MGKKIDAELREKISKASLNEKVHLINKALETSDFLNGGRLDRKQARVYEEFIRGTNDMMQNVDLRFIDRLRGKIDYMGFGGHVLQSHSEWTNFTGQTEPAFKDREYNLQKLSGGFDISFETMIENIEQENFRGHLITSFLKNAANDVSYVAVNGDTTSGDSLLQAMDGFYVLSAGGHIYDAQGAEVSRSLWHKAYRTMPKEFRRKNSLNWFMNSVLQDDYVEVLGNRATALGDTNVGMSGTISKIIGIPVRTVDEILDNYAVDYSSATHAEVTGTEQGWFTITTGSNDTVKLDVDNDGAVTVTLTAGEHSAVEIASQINTALAAAGSDEVAKTDGNGRLVLKSLTTGASSEIDIQAVANDAYTTLGLTVATTTGDAAGSNSINYGTYALLSNPMNFRVYVNREFRTNWTYDEDYDGWKFRFHHYMQPVIVWPEACVRADGIKLSDY